VARKIKKTHWGGDLERFRSSYRATELLKSFRGIARSALACFAALCALGVHNVAFASEEKARALAERAHPGKKVESVRKLPNAALYEIVMGRDLVYTDLDANVLLIGNVFDAKTLASITEARKTELLRFSPKLIPMETAIKTVRGNGRDAIYVFADPNCAFCKTFEVELLKLSDVTIHTVIYPVLGTDSLAKARDILCAPSPERAWRAWMDAGVAPPAANAACQPSFERIIAFGRTQEIGITPTTIYGIGDRVVGKVPAVSIESVVKRARG
jgi:thiol:disulfide interchange protein DsbC